MCIRDRSVTVAGEAKIPDALGKGRGGHGLRRVSAVAEGGVVMDGAEFRRHCIRSCLTL